MKKLIPVLFAMVLLPHLSFAQMIWFQANLNGWQENPPVNTSATGWATASLDLSSNLFVFHDVWSGLSAPSTASHIHAPAPIGTNAPVIIPFTAANGFIAGTTMGTVDYSGALTALQANQLLNGLFYVNVHSTSFPGGEIRGQLVPVPEPATYAAAGGALLLLALTLRLRKRHAEP
ncbi:MAG: CHRD domain-containing protein [Nibricoccus sp.]